MKLAALMPIRNEDWILGLSLRVALRWNDFAVCFLHSCTDGSAAIVNQVSDENPGRVFVISSNDDAWSEMSHRQSLLEAARDLGATHISSVDADEVLTGNQLPNIREQIEGLPPGGYMHVGMPCMWRSLTKYRTDGRIWARRNDLMLAFCDRPDLNWKPTNGYDHHCRAPHGSNLRFRSNPDNGGVMHLQFADWRRLVAKHMAYRVLEKLKYPNKPVAEIRRLYSLALDEGGLTTAETPPEWWAPYTDLMHHVHLRETPWQEQYVIEMITKYGTDYFEGLGLQYEALVQTA